MAGVEQLAGLLCSWGLHSLSPPALVPCAPAERNVEFLQHQLASQRQCPRQPVPGRDPNGCVRCWLLELVPDLTRGSVAQWSEALSLTGEGLMACSSLAWWQGHWAGRQDSRFYSQLCRVTVGKSWPCTVPQFLLPPLLLFA